MTTKLASEIKVGDCVKVDGYWHRVDKVMHDPFGSASSVTTIMTWTVNGDIEGETDGESYGPNALVTVTR
jgi:hypothetical protein